MNNGNNLNNRTTEKERKLIYNIYKSIHVYLLNRMKRHLQPEKTKKISYGVTDICFPVSMYVIFTLYFQSLYVFLCYSNDLF